MREHAQRHVDADTRTSLQYHALQSTQIFGRVGLIDESEECRSLYCGTFRQTRTSRKRDAGQLHSLNVMKLALVCTLAVAVLVVLILLGRRSFAREKMAKQSGHYANEFVVIEDDGTARELTPLEAQYLNTEFRPADGARPYIKGRYASLTPDGRIGGFLRKRKVPNHVRIHAGAAHNGG